MDVYIGAIQLFPFGYAPIGWLECKGQTIVIQQNAALYSLIGANFGGDGKTTFCLPDLQDASPIPTNSKYCICISGFYPPRS